MKTAASGSRRVRERPRPAPTRGLRYLESSALLRVIIDRGAAVDGVFGASDRFVASALTFAEAGRMIARERALGRFTLEQAEKHGTTLATISARCEILPITSEILARSRLPFPIEPVRTLDAIHLATIEAIGGPDVVQVVTTDKRVASNAAALGYPVIGV